jgi:hypothetical protein
MRDPTNVLFSFVLMKQDLDVADSSYLPWSEAYKHSLSLSSLLLSMPCWEGKPYGRRFYHAEAEAGRGTEAVD